MLPAWMLDGACAGYDANAAEFRELLVAREHTAAKMLCLECPVRLQCLRWALEKQEIWDVWGGLSEGEIRRALSLNSRGECIKRSRPPQCPACWARTSRLVVCKGSGGLVTCCECAFEWRSVTTARAVRAYHRERSQKKKSRTGIAAGSSGV